MEMLREILENLAKNRNVNNAFMERLEKAGFKIRYGKYDYWQGIEYIQIGDVQVFLQDSYCCGNSLGIGYRKQIDVVEELTTTIKEEYKKLQNEDTKIEEFFNKLNK